MRLHGCSQYKLEHAKKCAHLLGGYPIGQDGEAALKYLTDFTDGLELPRGPKATGTEAEVCEDIEKRQQLGILKYQITVADNPLELREWLQHAYEECLDQAVYLKRAISELQ